MLGVVCRIDSATTPWSGLPLPSLGRQRWKPPLPPQRRASRHPIAGQS